MWSLVWSPVWSLVWRWTPARSRARVRPPPPTRAEETRRPVRQGEGSSTVGRRELRRQRVRRRRILALLGGVVLVVVLAFAFWYELESHALGPAGRREVVQVTSGESMGSIASQLAAHHVIGSTLAFRFFNLVHGSPTVLPGDYALRGNETFAQVRAALAAGPNIYAVTINRGLTLQEVATQVDGLPGHAPGGFTRVANSGAVHSEFSPAGSNDLEGMLGTGTYLVVPGESDTTLLTDMVHRFDGQAEAAGLSATSASALGMTPYQVITAASIVEKEGYYFKNMPDVARVIYNRLADGHAAADELHGPVLARPGRRPGDSQGPGAADAVQHLPEHRAHADTDLHALPAGAHGGGAPTARSVALLCAGEQGRHRGVLRHLRGTVGQ